MRIDEILASDGPVFSFEFFPPKTEAGEKNLYAALAELRTLEPAFVSVTYGAGGSTREKTIEIVKRIREEYGLEAMALPVYARGVCPNGCNKDGPGEVGAIVACGGVAVRPGDVVIADRDGVTVVPLEDAAEVAKLAAEQMAREEKRLAEIMHGVLTRPEIDETLRKLKVIE